MKRVLVSALSIMMLLVATPIYATEGSNLDDTTSSGETEISYSLDETYSITIPADFSLTGNETAQSQKKVKIAVNSFKIAPGHYVAVKASSANGYKLKNGTSEIPYVLNNNGPYYGDNEDSGVADIIAIYNKSDFPDNYEERKYNTPGAATYQYATEAKEFEIGFFFKDGAFANATLAGDYTDTLTFSCSIESLTLKK